MTEKPSKSSGVVWFLLTAGILAVTFWLFQIWGSDPSRGSQFDGKVQIEKKDFAAVAAGVSPARLKDTVESLASLGSRLSGSPGCDAAALLLSSRLEEILGPGSVKAETFGVDNPFDLGSEIEAGDQVFRVHPFWAPSISTYFIPEGGLELGKAFPTSFSNLLKLNDLKGRAAVLELPGPPEIRQLVQTAFDMKVFPPETVTLSETRLLTQLQSEKRPARGKDEEATLDAVGMKTQVLLASLALKRWSDSGLRSLLFREPPGQPARVPAHTFADRLLKNDSKLLRYLVPAEATQALSAGTAVKVRQAPAALTLLDSGQSLRLYPLWPNVVRTASTPAHGIEGPLLLAGRGGLEDVKGKKVAGAVVLVDFNCGYNWVELADLGAKAVLFAEPDSILRGEAETKYLTVPANIPRYWLPRKTAELLKKQEGKSVRLDAQVVWERRQASNLVGRLDGTLPGGWDKPVIIEAHYDSISVVPDLAPGAEQACGPAALLELARVLKAHPLKKPVLFVLTAGHAQNLLGWREYLWRHVLSPAADFRPSFVADLDLTSGSRRLGVFFKADSFDALEDVAHTVMGNLGFSHGDACRLAASSLGYGDDFFVDAINPSGGLRWHDYLPGKFALAQEMTLHAGLYGVAYATPDDERVHVDTPQDLASGVDFQSLSAQTRVLACALPNVLNVEGAFAGTKLTNYWNNLKARVVEFDPRVSYMPDRTVDGAMVWLHNKRASKSYKGVRGQHFVQAFGKGEQGGGIMEVHGLPHNDWQANGEGANMRCEAFELDPLDGAIRYAPDETWLISTMDFAATQQRAGFVDTRELILITFPCASLLFYDLVDPLNYKPLNRLRLLDAHTDSPPVDFGLSLPVGQDLTSFLEPLAMVYAPEGINIKATFSSSALGQRGALLNATEKEPEGRGYLLGRRHGLGQLAVGINGELAKSDSANAAGEEQPDSLQVTSLRMAEDLWTLNQFRIDRMKRHGISNHYLDGLHGQASEKLKESKQALASLDYQTAISSARASWGLSARVYPDVKATASDVVQSAMLFLALLIPFAYLAERLFLGYPGATQQVTAIGGIFLAMFMVLRAVHPAFQIALTPVMILLSFIIIALSIILSGVIGSRFFDFLKESREKMQGVHQSEVSRLSLTLAAFSIGVSNMRKRPLRTFLTSLTVVVLTFAVLSLTSVVQALKQKKFSLEKPATYEGLLFRDPKWANLNDATLDRLKAELSGLGTLSPRAWINPGKADPMTGVEIQHAYTKRANAGAVLGLKPGEDQVTGVGRAVKTGTWFKPGDTQAVILPENLATALGVSLPQVEAGKASVRIFGLDFAVRGVFDSKIFQDIHDLDDENLVPVNFEATQQRDAAQSTQQSGQGQLPGHYLHRDAAQTIILPYDTLMRLGGTLVSVALPMSSTAAIQSTVKELLNRLGLLVYVGVEKKTYAYSAVGGTTTGGLDDLLVPVLIAALIIFSTMLGAVQERRREIGVFSSVGLAPNHVAVLFLAEACVYAILGAAVGYLIGQGFSQLVSHGLVFKGLNVNYSSNAAIMAMVIVMAVVLLSTLYPASLASKLARPSQAVDFTLPPLTGDEVKLELPFSFNARDAQAVCAFLGEYFHAHGEASAGDFSTEDIRLSEKTENGQLVWQVSTRVWLAPYDFGVSQDLCFSMSQGIGHVSSAGLLIHRLSGDQASWYRVNARFLKDVRKQFLIWRSLNEPARQRYQNQAISQMKNPKTRGRALVEA